MNCQAHLHRNANGREVTRRWFLEQCGIGLGSVALGQLLAEASLGDSGLSVGEGSAVRGSSVDPMTDNVANPLAPKSPHFAGRAKNVIYLFMGGAPSHLELLDHKPLLSKFDGTPPPAELIKDYRAAFINPSARLLGPRFKFARHGQCGAEISELLPHLAGLADDVAIVRSMVTTAFNHAPAQLFLYTGSPRFGGASLGSWATYGLGSENENLPGFVVLISGGTDPSGGKSLWGGGFLPSVYQGVQCRTQGEPILFVTNPKGMSREVRRRSLDTLRRLNELELQQFGDPETLTRISQYELAFRMQMSVPDVMDMKKEPQHVQDAYGVEPGKESFANCCLLARRLVEQGVRYVQLFNYGWDMHGTGTQNDLMTALPQKAKEIDRPIAALLRDLKQRGLLDETLVIWSGEFGRTALNEERNGSKFLGRDHHPHCFTVWMAGGGVRGGTNYGATDELGYFVADNRVGVHDLQATILHLLGFDPHRFGYRYQGLDQRLIGPEGDAQVVHELLA